MGESGVKSAVEIAQVLRVKPEEEVAGMFLKARNGIVLANGKVDAGRVDPLSPLGRRYISGVRDALAWVLNVDLGQMDDPKPAALVEAPKGVQVSWIDAYACWFVEFPPDEMQAKQQYRAEFLSMRQARELCDELWECLRARAYLGGSEFAEWAAEHAASRRRGAMWSASASSSALPVQLSSVLAVRSCSASSASSGGDGGDVSQGA